MTTNRILLSADSFTDLQSSAGPSSPELTRPRKHARRTSLPVSNHQGTFSIDPQGGVDLSHYNSERRRFRDTLGGPESKSASRRRGPAPSGSNGAVRKTLPKSSSQMQEIESDDENLETDEAISAFNSSTTHAASPSGAGRESDALSSSDASSSDRPTYDWDTAKKRNSSNNNASVASQQRKLLNAEAADRKRIGRSSSFRNNSPRDSSQHNTPTLRKRELEPQGELQGASTAVNRGNSSHLTVTNDNASPSGTSRFSPTIVEANIGVGQVSRRATKPVQRKLFVSSAIEMTMLIAAGVFACFRLWKLNEDLVSPLVYELAFIVASSTFYCFLRSPAENGTIWATDERNYRPCGDDGAICGLLLGPLLAFTCLVASLADQVDYRPASGDSLINPPWNIERPQLILGTRTVPHPTFSALSLSRCSLLSLQTITSTTLLCHLLATKWIRKPADLSRSNWKKLRSFMKFSLVLSALLAVVREAFIMMEIPIWTKISRSELIMTSLLFQTNLYTISRLARKSFTLGELSIVCTVGVTLCVEMLNLTTAKLFPASTPYVKTFRRPTPLLVFQLALVDGTFTIGFLLSPLLYLSRHLAQKPVHRLRWPHKRDLHRRLLAGFFYFFAALYVVGVLGLWVWWMLGRRNPWLWTMHFVLEGEHWWSRPLLIAYWLALVSISISGWQATNLSGRRIRIRPAGASVNGQQITIEKESNDAQLKKMKGITTHSSNTDASLPNGSLGFAKKAAYLSLNARRKFFHALAVLLFTPGIAYDPAFSHLAFSLAFSAFIFAEYVRYYALYPFGATLHIFMSEFTDHKDSGPVILSHFYLLTGCASTIWIEGVRTGSNLARKSLTRGLWPFSGQTVYTGLEQNPSNADISMFIGVLSLGVGDALASIVGRRYGKICWPGSSKTLEGSLAFMASIFATSLLLRGVGWCAPFSVCMLPRSPF